jgi:hypothetical protein
MRSLTRGAASATLAAAIVAGSFVVWIGIPAGFIWVSSRTAHSLADALAILLGACPLAMAAFAFLLAKLNGVYLRASGTHPDQRHSAWLKSLSGGRTLRQPRPVLEVSMTISAASALIVLLVWFFFFAHSSLPAAP